MNYILYDDPLTRENLLPLTFTRPIATLRVGILTLAEKWMHHLGTSVSYHTASYLQEKFPLVTAEDNVYINATVCPTSSLTKAVKALQQGQALYQGEQLLAYRHKEASPQHLTVVSTTTPYRIVRHLYDIFTYNGEEIAADFMLLTAGRESQPITDLHTIVYHPEKVFIEEGASIKACVLNAANGYIYIGKNAQVQEMSVLQGNFALCEGAVVNIGGKMRSNTTIGPYCKVGGEINNCVLTGYSNKAHDGFLGNAVIGEWCNLGADTNCSNLKNNYSNVRLWNYPTKTFMDTGKQFCGLMMGDHSKTGINTMFNTGTVVGVCSNVVGGSFPPKFVPSFSWHKGDALEVYQLAKAFVTAEKVMQRRKKTFTAVDQQILQYIYELDHP
ncbi:MAG: GlmU family protein [Thermonemataceae bacterium]